jgi:ubiquinone/menaquinone biosynthesis C-methylase UbiE
MRYKVWEKLAHKYNDLWVQKYSLGPTRREVKKILFPLLEKGKDINILDIGCGTGQLIGEISEKYNNYSYLGIDVANNMIEEAKKNNSGIKANFKVCPVEDFFTEEKYDVIICTHSFPYFPRKEEMLVKISGMCQKEGKVIIINSSTNNLKDLITNFFLKATTSKAKYLSILQMKELFKVAELKVVNIDIIKEKWYMPTIAVFHLER